MAVSSLHAGPILTSGAATAAAGPFLLAACRLIVAVRSECAVQGVAAGAV